MRINDAKKHPQHATRWPVKISLREVTETDAGLVVALVAAAILRLLGVLARPIWYDEAFAILFAREGPARMLVGTLTPTGAGSADIHPLGYYSLLWLWMRALGESLLSARGLSILAGLGTVAVAYVLTRSMVDRRTAFVGALLLASSPFQVHYSQEIRMYAFLGLWLSLVTLSYWMAVQGAGWGWWLVFSGSAALAQYTHNLAAAYLLALGMWPVLRAEWRIVWRVGLAALGTALLYAPWLIHLPAQFAKVSQYYWIEQPAPYRLLALPLAYLTNLPVPSAALGIALFAAIGVVVLGGISTIRGVRMKRRRDIASQWMLYLSFAPGLLLFMISQWRPIFLERALIASGVAFCVWLACQLSDEAARPAARWIMAILTATAFGIGLWQHLAYRGFPYAPFDSAAADVRDRLKAGDVVIHSSKLSFLPSMYYQPGLPATYIADPPGSSTDTLAPSTQAVLGIHAAANLEEATGAAQRVWFALFGQSNQEYVQAGYERHPDLDWLLQRYSLEETIEWNDLTIYLFSSPTAQ